ncbi:MAG: hypothetical protein O3C40_19250 [Planctomycetota bacterium]|nr:hypothetical protein [Planctomycetota bacterium]
MSDDQLPDHFQKLAYLVDVWFIEEPAFIEFMRIYGVTYLEPVGIKTIPESARDEFNRRGDERGNLKRRIDEHAQPVLKFADDEGLPVAPLLRFLRAVNDQCKFSDLNQEDIRDAVQAAYLRSLNETPTDGPIKKGVFVWTGTRHRVPGVR